jgi:DNA-binding transcriptional regulator YhcF (GntR family)
MEEGTVSSRACPVAGRGGARLPSTREAGRGRQISEFKVSLVYKVSSRTARATQRNPISKIQKKKKKKKKERKKERKKKELAQCMWDCERQPVFWLS